MRRYAIFNEGQERQGKMPKWTEEKIEALAKAYFQHVDGVLEMEDAWNEMSGEAKQYFIERMRWAIEHAKV